MKKNPGQKNKNRSENQNPYKALQRCSIFIFILKWQIGSVRGKKDAGEGVFRKKYIYISCGDEV